MGLLVTLIDARRTIEVGVFIGYSALSDDGRVIACDVSREYTDAARGCWRKAGVEHKIDLSLLPIADGLTLARKR